MKTIGLLGGMSWGSTLEYYRILNQEVAKRLGGLSSAKILLHSVDFAEFEAWLRADDWDSIARELGAAAKGLARAGADMILICTNTMHCVADQVCKASGLPLIHIGEATATQVQKAGLTKVGLLGSKPVMELNFYCAKLVDKGVEAVIPSETDREIVHRIIFEELVKGVFTDESRKEYIRIIEELQNMGAQGVILGCTEIPLLLSPEDYPLPMFDTTSIHALAAVEAALG